MIWLTRLYWAFHRERDNRIQAALNWLIGSINGRGWAELKITAPYIGIALLLGCFLVRSVNILSLGDDLAVGLGRNSKFRF